MESLTVVSHDSYARYRSARYYTVPDSDVALLTATSKMPGPSWGLPAHESCHRANGTICEDCYAEKNCYDFAVVEHAQAVRFAWTRQCMKTAEGRRQWVEVMVTAIHGEQYFRVHDSGDMFSPAYAESWYEVFVRLPLTAFWVPTRVWQQPSGPLPVFDPLMAIMRRMALLPNVTVRPSALNFRDYAPVVAGLHAGTSADQPDVFRAAQCLAPSQGGHCGDCRTCWDEKDIPVNYEHH